MDTGYNQPATIAPVEHVPSHAPQSMHCSGSITNWVSPELIAPTGQLDSQAPQAVQESVITYAIA